ncbi:hypothetical protein ADL00_26655 [Streptomyces sp. AS58]|nr:hypothetical protein ADL00_26655 [Streptomyces sp. AS58]
MEPSRSVGVLQQSPVDASEPLFRRFPVDAPTSRLVCLPHAGGNAGLFHDWPYRLAPGIEVLAVQYAGRQDRLADPFPQSLEDLADEIAGQLLPYLDVPVSLFGHSMGAPLAYEVARRLEDYYPDALAHLFVSARPAPSAGAHGIGHQINDADLVAWAVKLGGPGSEAYTDQNLRDLVLPSLRSDLTLLSAYSPAEITRLEAPITAFGGTEDPDCAPTELATWQGVTASEFDVRVFDGDHFYLVSHTAALAHEISSRSPTAC